MVGCIEVVREQLVQLYQLAAQFQAVHVLCPHELQPDCRTRLQSSELAENIHFFDYQTDDVWCRILCPFFAGIAQRQNCGSVIGALTRGDKSLRLTIAMMPVVNG